MRAVIVHSRDARINADAKDPTPARAHCFGPFDSLEEAELFEQSAPPDDCYKVVLPITGPWPEDVQLAIAYEREHGHDERLN
jgi:hypothetical protein